MHTYISYHMIMMCIYVCIYIYIDQLLQQFVVAFAAEVAWHAAWLVLIQKFPHRRGGQRNLVE